MIQEFETTEILEMVYLYYVGIPYEINRDIPRRVKMIFKGDLSFIKGKVDDFWAGNTRVDAQKLLTDYQCVKRLLWVGQEYDPNFYKNEKNKSNSAKS